MGLSLRRRLPALGAALCLVVLAWDSRAVWRAQQFNAAIAAPAAAVQVQGRGMPAALLFVHAHAAAQAGHTQEALALYREAADDPAWAVAAHYNSGNLHLREALELAQNGTLAQTPQAVELAKQHYREALRRDPAHWPSRYNLERALWLAPELPDDGVAGPPPLNSERAITTMRGFSIGLP